MTNKGFERGQFQRSSGLRPKNIQLQGFRAPLFRLEIRGIIIDIFVLSPVRRVKAPKTISGIQDPLRTLGPSLFHRKCMKDNPTSN